MSDLRDPAGHPSEWPLRTLTEIGLAVALAVVLDALVKSLPLPRLPYGGSIGLRMVPLLVVALRHGVRAGIWAGAVYGIVDFVLFGLYFHPIQVLVDYPLAHAALGLSGFWAGTGACGWSRWIGGILTGAGGRFFCHFLSGIVFFAAYAPEGQSVWAYSAAYNISYIVPETAICIALVPVIRRLVRA